MGKTEKIGLEQLPQESKNVLLFSAIKGYKETKLDKLLLAGANANAVDEDDPSGWTELARRAKSGQTFPDGVDYTQRLINAKAVNADCGGWTALTLAAKIGEASVVKTLLDSGASVNKRGGNLNATALHYAVRNGRKTAIGVLLEFHATFDATDNELKTPLHYAAVNPNLEPSMIQFLLFRHRAKKSLELVDCWGRTPLLWAAEKAKPGIVETFLSAGANPKVIRSEGEHQYQTSLHYAVCNPNAGVIRVLLEHMKRSCHAETKTLVNHKSHEGGNTALHLAYERENKEAIKCLEHNGADGTIKNDEDKTPLEMRKVKGETPQ